MKTYRTWPIRKGWPHLLYVSNMADNLLSSFPITELLSALGARPGRSRNTYHSPFREDANASLCIDPERNIWYDHGAGAGGGNIDLVMRCRGCTAREAAEYILSLKPCGSDSSYGSSRSNGSYGGSGSRGSSVGSHSSSDCDSKGSSGSGKPKNPQVSRILMVRELRSPFLLEYAESRGIPSALAARYCKEVVLRGKTYGHAYDHIGFPNNVGGFALKAPSGFKCTTKGGITTIDAGGRFSELPTSESVTVFEGFFDFLSWLASRKNEVPTTDVVVLNSVTNLGRALAYLKEHRTIICCLDRDAAGVAALETLRGFRHELGNPVIIDGSLFYDGYKDVNEWWVGTMSLK